MDYRKSQRYKFHKHVALGAMTTTIYMIWRIRSSAYCDSVVMTIEKIIHEIKYMVTHIIKQIISPKVKD